ncbi:MAG: fibronectin type III domain-containing protein [Paracoccaceae bacterium]|nr:fibronectin type III domain-containing protein [Paracoccaceae bacterium]
MTCARREAGAHRLAASASSRSPSSRRTPPEGRSRPAAPGGRARLFLLLPVLALLLSALGLFAPASAQAQTTVWSATLTVKDSTNNRGCFGSASNACSVTSVLSDDEFDYGGQTYTIETIRWYYESGDDELSVEFDKAVNTALSTLTLTVGTGMTARTYAVKDANAFDSGKTLGWTAGALGWNAGDTVALKLTAPAAPAGPSVTGALAITSDAGTYTTDDDIVVEVTFDKTIVVVGTPELTIKVGRADRVADCVHKGSTGDDAKKLECTYTIVDGDNDDDGVSVEANKLSLPTSPTTTIKDSNGNDATLTHNALAAQSAHIVDAKAPAITGLAMASTPASGSSYAATEVIKVEVTFSEEVTVSIGSGESITLALTVGAATKTMTCTHKGSTGEDAKKLVCSYTVASGDADADGVSVAAGSLALSSGASIEDGQTFSAVVTHTGLATQSGHKVGAAPPAAPTGFSATAVVGGARLSWTAPTDATIAKHQYRVKAGTAAWGSWQDATGTSAFVTGLMAGTQYRFQLRAVNAANTPGASASAGPVIPLAVGTGAPAGQTVAADWALIPKDSSNNALVSAGGKFRLLFVTSGNTTATSTDISTYNAFVQRAAGSNTNLASFRTQFRALVSTATVDARDNTATTGTGVPIYWVQGAKVADTYADFYDGSWDSVAGKTETGGTPSRTGIIWTGSNNDGTKHSRPAGHSTAVRSGALASGQSPLSDGVLSLVLLGATQRSPLYGLSPVLTVRATSGKPAKPTGLTATAGNAQVALSWTDPSDSTITKYQYQQKAGSAAWGSWKNITGSSATTTSHTVTSLINGTAYRFRIRAVNSAGNSPQSEVAGPVTPTAAAKPKLSLVLAATTIAESGSGNSTTVKATLPSAVTSSVTVTLSATPAGKVTLGATTLTIAANATESGTVTVTAVDNDVDAADAAVTISGSTTSTAVTAPDAVTLTVTDDDTKGVTVEPTSLTVNEGATATYKVKLDSEPLGRVVVTPSSGDTGAATVSGPLTFTSATWSTEQTVTVTGVADADTDHETVTVTHAVSSASVDYQSVTADPVTVSVSDNSAPPAPPAPATLMADTPQANAIRLTWSPGRTGARVDKYVIEVSSDAGATWTQLAIHTTTIYTHSGLAAGAVRHYRVKGRNTGGGVDVDSAWSNTATATALGANAPAAPTGLAASAVDGGVRLTWTDPSDAAITGYEYQQTISVGAVFRPFGAWTPIPGSGAATTGYTVTGLTPGVLHSFRLRAVKGNDKGIPSSAVTATPTGMLPAPAPLTLPWDWKHQPADGNGDPAFEGGQSFRLLFVTKAKRDAASADIGVYNRFVQAEAPFAGARALISAGATDARGNTGTGPADANTGYTAGEGVPIYWVGGSKVADHYMDFYDGSWDSGWWRGGEVWTGSISSGELRVASGGIGPAGSARVEVGLAGVPGKGLASGTAAASGGSRALYGLSPVITLGTPPVPGPKAVQIRQGWEARNGPGKDALQVMWQKVEGRGFVCDYRVEWKKTALGDGDTGGEFEYSAERRIDSPGLYSPQVFIKKLTPGTSYTVRVRRSGGAYYSPWFLVGEKTFLLPAEQGAPPPITAAGPALSWARVNAAELALRFDASLDETSVPAASAFAVSVAGSARSVSAVAVSQSTVTLTLASAVSSGEAVTVGYTPPSTGALRASGGGANVAAFSGTAVTNDTGSRQVQAPPPVPLTASVANAPAEHRGRGKFTVQIAFSEAVAGRPKDAAATIAVTGGTLSRARRAGGASRWALDIKPSSHAAVTLVLPATSDCSATGAICTADGRKLGTALTHTVPGPVTLSVADAQAAEGPGATIDFPVTLSRAASGPVTVRYATRDGTAKKRRDYRKTSGTLTFAAGETAKTVSVTILDDAHDEGTETFTLRLSKPKGAAITDGEATGTITNADPLQRDWLARFGRAAAADAVAAVTARLETPRDAGSHVTLGGHRLALGGSGGKSSQPPEPAGRPGGAPWLSWSGEPAGEYSSRAMSGRELLMGTSFRAVLGNGAGPQWTGWGQGASVSAFSSAGPGLSLSGETATGSMGMDYEWGRLLTGFAMTHSLGEGTAEGAGRSYVMGSTVTTMLPYLRVALSERVSAWGLAGTGTGRLTLDLAGGAPERYGADLTMSLAAMGVRGDLVTPAEAGGFALALKADAFWVRTESDAVSVPGAGNLAAARGEASRLRAVLDGSRSFALAGGATLTPSVAFGVRHDGGDAETGTGLEFGAGLGYAAPSRGLDMALRVHGLASHAEDGYGEWGVSGSLRLVPGAAGRGLSMSLTPSYGADPGGSERLWMLPDVSGLAANGGAARSGRLDAELGYGLALFGGGFTGTPHVGLGLSETDREVRMGWRLSPADDGDFSFRMDASRRDSAGDGPEHRIGFGVTARW